MFLTMTAATKMTGVGDDIFPSGSDEEVFGAISAFWLSLCSAGLLSLVAARSALACACEGQNTWKDQLSLFQTGEARSW
jgi:hypothetical protein